MFRKFSLFNYLVLIAAILAAHPWLRALPDRAERPDALVPVRFSPVGLDPSGFAPLRLAGAWRVAVGDARFGGISALAVDGDRLVALTDSGSVIRLPRPGGGSLATVHDLPAGPGNPSFKYNRDSEALARDGLGRGWWVAFENRNQLFLYDPGFRRALARIDLGRRRWPHNKGIEAMAPASGGLLLFPEGGGEQLALGFGQLRTRPLRNRFGRLADAAALPDGRTLVLGRRLRLGGFENRLLVLGFDGRGMALSRLADLPVRALDNVEAIAAERHSGGNRLWLMTDNDFRPRGRTLLVALDLP